METLLLRENERYPVYNHLISVISNEPYSLEHQWNYYKDGKSWLCKVTYRQKTIFWLSVWDTCFKIGFYFTEKTKPAIFDLAISDSIKHSFSNSKNIGKLIPLVINLTDISQIEDVLRIVEFKKACK